MSQPRESAHHGRTESDLARPADSSGAGGPVLSACELRITGVDRDAALAAARWELFVFADVRHVCRVGVGDRAAIIYEGAEPDLEAWIEALAEAGYGAEPLAEAGRSLKVV